MFETSLAAYNIATTDLVIEAAVLSGFGFALNAVGYVQMGRVFQAKTFKNLSFAVKTPSKSPLLEAALVANAFVADFLFFASGVFPTLAATPPSNSTLLQAWISLFSFLLLLLLLRRALLALLVWGESHTAGRLSPRVQQRSRRCATRTATIAWAVAAVRPIGAYSFLLREIDQCGQLEQAALQTAVATTSTVPGITVRGSTTAPSAPTSTDFDTTLGQFASNTLGMVLVLSSGAICIVTMIAIFQLVAVPRCCFRLHSGEALEGADGKVHGDTQERKKEPV